MEVALDWRFSNSPIVSRTSLVTFNQSLPPSNEPTPESCSNQYKASQSRYMYIDNHFLFLKLPVSLAHLFLCSDFSGGLEEAWGYHQSQNQGKPPYLIARG